MIDFTKVLFAVSDSIRLHMYCSVFISRLKMMEDEKVVGLAAKLIVARKTTPDTDNTIVKSIQSTFKVQLIA